MLVETGKKIFYLSPDTGKESGNISIPDISAVSHPVGTKQGRGESSGKFASKPLEDLSWRGLIRRVFQHLQHVNCSCGQRDFRSLDALIRHIERSHPKDMDSVTFCTRTTLDRSTSSHCSIVTVTKKIWQRNISRIQVQ